MSSPTDRSYESGDPSPYAPRWVRNAPPQPRAPVRSPLVPQGSETDDQYTLHRDDAVGTDRAPPFSEGAEEESFAVGDFRVPRSLDPGIVPDPWAERGVRLRRYRLLGMLGRLALAGSAAAIVALLVVGKLSVPGSTGATEQADTSPAFGTHVSAPPNKPQEPPIVAQETSEPPPQQIALADPATPVTAPRPSVPVPPAAMAPAAVAPAAMPPPVAVAPAAPILTTPAPEPAAATPPAPAAGPAASAPASELAPEELAALLQRGQHLAASGDIAAARLTLRPAAEARNAQAALALGATYDPVVLHSLGIFGVTPDVAMARGWYEKAREYGSAEAPRRLDMLAKTQ
jgi:TPR repeat protein